MIIAASDFGSCILDGSDYIMVQIFLADRPVHEPETPWLPEVNGKGYQNRNYQIGNRLGCLECANEPVLLKVML